MTFVSGCATPFLTTLTEDDLKARAAAYARKSDKCAELIERFPKILVDIGDPDFDVIARHGDRTTREETAYQLPRVRKMSHGYRVQFWHNGHAYDGTSYYIYVFMTRWGTLDRIETAERPGGYM